METVSSGNNPGFVANNLILNAGQPATYTSRKGSNSAVIILRKVEREEFEITARIRKKFRGSSASDFAFDLVDTQGRIVAIAYSFGGGGAILPQKYQVGLLDMGIVGFKATDATHTRGESQLDLVLKGNSPTRSPAFSKLKEGQKLRAFGYRPLSMETGKLDLP